MAFNIKDFLNEESRKEVIDNFPIKKISVKKLHPSSHNFYNIDPKEIEALKNTIELVGIQENLVVREITEGELSGEYEIIAGHKRHLAISELANEGRASEFVPCKIESSKDSTLRELILIFTNSTQRERSDFEKMHEIQKVRELLEDYAKEKELPGRKRDVIAEILNTSKSTVARLDNIRRHLIPEFMKVYKDGKMATATANEIAGADEEGQKALWELYQKNGFLKRNEVAEVKREENHKPASVEVEEPEESQKTFLQEEMEKEEQESIFEPEKAEMQQDNTSETETEKIHQEEKAEMQQDKTKEEVLQELEEQEEIGQEGELEVEEAEPEEQIPEEENTAQKVDVGYWGKETARELASLAAWLREEELAVIQEIVLKLRERKEKNDK